MSCFGGHDEQIYLFEILIDKLTLTPDKIKDIGQNRIMIKIKFLDFPVFEIMREDLDISRAGPRNQNTTMHFMIGTCCFFTKKPRDLVRELHSTNVKIGVFCVGDTYPTAETELTLPGCLCDQIAMVRNDPKNLPKPFSVQGGFHLLDPGENPSGTLYLELSLACLGRAFMADHKLYPKFLVSGEQDKDREICVKRFVPPEFLTDRMFEEVVPQDITLTSEMGKQTEDKGKKKVKEAKKKKGKK